MSPSEPPIRVGDIHTVAVGATVAEVVSLCRRAGIRQSDAVALFKAIRHPITREELTRWASSRS